ncbi:MAG: hypothetical protein M1836_005048 [Candelina mexicana]|nr:MAG: hypothetical protein M1836_005048 [Candelina mexicana]
MAPDVLPRAQEALAPDELVQSYVQNKTISEEPLNQQPNPSKDRKSTSQHIVTTKEVVAVSPLGTFQMLPPELRDMVWQYFIPEGKSEIRQRQGLVFIKPIDYAGESDDLAIMRTSRHINDELCGVLYDRQVLCIEIDPPNDRWWAYRGLPGPTGDGYFPILKHTNLAWFKQIRIVLLGPNQEDPGPLLLLRRILINLVKRLSDSAALPDIHIDLSGCRADSWYTSDGKLQRSIGGDPQDIIVVLRAFRCLHKVTKVTLSLPNPFPVVDGDLVQEADQRDLRSCAEDVKAIMEFQEAFFERSVKIGSKQDRHIMREETTQTLRHDLVLDGLKGHAAAMLRLFRFADWQIYNRMFEKAIARSDLDEIERATMYAGLRKRNGMRQVMHPRTGYCRYKFVEPDNEETTWCKRYEQRGMPSWC